MKKELDKIPGVLSVSVSVDEGTVTVDYDSTGTSLKQIKEGIIEAGYEVELE